MRKFSFCDWCVTGVCYSIAVKFKTDAASAVERRELKKANCLKEQDAKQGGYGGNSATLARLPVSRIPDDWGENRLPVIQSLI